MVFSKRIVLIYSLVIIIPLFIISVLLVSGSMHNQINRQKTTAIENLQENYEDIVQKVKSINTLEKSIRSDNNFNLFLINPDNYTEEEIIDFTRNKTAFIEQVLEVNPVIYGLRIFAKSEKVPERWPVLLHESRMAGAAPERWEYDYKADFLGNQLAMQNDSFCTTRNLTKNHRHVGYLQISVKMEDFFPSLYNKISRDEHEYILKKNYKTGSWEFFTDSRLEKLNPVVKQREINYIARKIERSGEKKDVIKFNAWNRIMAWQYIDDLDIYLIHINFGHTFAIELLSFFAISLMVIFMIIVMLFMVIRKITESTMSGIYSLMKGMKQVRSGDFSVQLALNGVDEVQEAQETFNKMVSRLSSQIELIKKEQSLIADTEMKAMQNQINAHFLYNVLETIRMQAVLADQNEIEESLQVLGKMMRYCLRWRIHRVPLAQEIEYIRSYVYILNIRNDYKISLLIDIPDELMDIEIPKMTLQPLIENAFVHAIEKEEKDSSLKVFSTPDKKGDRVYLSVQDFGCGMSEEQVSKITDYLADTAYERDSTGSIGLKNIQQRLTVFYGADYKLQVKSELGKGTTISVPVPLKKVE